ncbi:hypothetical protein HanXRQr2_Chr10g0462301 [Helianthus annuus]|uniref:Uncharacterized protein n=1 Tax=Helianthus annuus TaxID=4232 RepID=A0A9K3I0D0_HELAN|nr:hypothetical protein HanXRQr2_Chr10g0462301 [Helianthus annuus]KAJ0885522.1 hypothetical protein HanPSC8_Chr10g0446161 [Helianthus annuus]
MLLTSFIFPIFNCRKRVGKDFANISPTTFTKGKPTKASPIIVRKNPSRVAIAGD